MSRTVTAYGYDPFGNRLQIGVVAKRPLHYGDVSRFRISRSVVATFCL